MHRLSHDCFSWSLFLADYLWNFDRLIAAMLWNSIVKHLKIWALQYFRGRLNIFLWFFWIIYQLLTFKQSVLPYHVLLGLTLSRGSDRVNNHSIARKTRGLNVNRMFVITARNHSTGQSHLIILKKEDPGCSLRQRACFCLLQQPAEPVRWRRWPRSRDLPRHLTIDTSLVFVQVDPGEKSAVSTNLLCTLQIVSTEICRKCLLSKSPL